jgi:hypothetical protein
MMLSCSPIEGSGRGSLLAPDFVNRYRDVSIAAGARTSLIGDSWNARLAANTHRNFLRLLNHGVGVGSARSTAMNVIDLNGDVPATCSFCGKHRSAVTFLVVVTGAGICDKCIETCVEIVVRRRTSACIPPDENVPGLIE